MAVTFIKVHEILHLCILFIYGIHDTEEGASRLWTKYPDISRWFGAIAESDGVPSGSAGAKAEYAGVPSGSTGVPSESAGAFAATAGATAESAGGPSESACAFAVTAGVPSGFARLPSATAGFRDCRCYYRVCR